MLLFIDRLPLYSWMPSGGLSDERLLSVCFPLFLSNPHASPPPRAKPQRWSLDTRFTGEVFAWRHHLVEAGLDPDLQRVGSARFIPLGGTPLEFPLRLADLWLISNIPALRVTPYCIELKRGIAFRDAQSLPNAETNCPLLGMRALESAGLKVAIDARAQTVSVWIPGAWHQQAWHQARRLATGFKTVMEDWGGK